MKAILICLILGLTLSYDPQAAIAYADTYCRNYNPRYNNYPEYIRGNAAHFISECLRAGGLDFSGCANLNKEGMIPDYVSLQNCLVYKYGWKKYTTRPPNYKPGYPTFLKYGPNAFLVVGIQGDNLYIDSHTPDRCHIAMDETILVYYYP